jgi:hypothetical protein
MAGWRQRGTELWCELAHDLPRSLAPSYHCVLSDTNEHVLWGRSTVIGRQFVAAAKITYGIDVYRYRRYGRVRARVSRVVVYRTPTGPLRSVAGYGF